MKSDGPFAGYSDADLTRAVKAERRACVQLVWLAYAKHKAAEDECEAEGNAEEAEMHGFEAMTLERLAQDIEKRDDRA